MKLILLNKEHKDEVSYLYSALLKFQKEVYGSKVPIDVNVFISSHFAIYLVVDNNDEFCGFTSFIYNDYFTMREPTVGNSYLYIEKEARRTKAMHLISIQAGKVASQLGLSLEHYIANESASEKFIGRLDGKKVYTTYEFRLTEVIRETNRLMSKLNLKETQ